MDTEINTFYHVGTTLVVTDGLGSQNIVRIYDLLVILSQKNRC